MNGIHQGQLVRRLPAGRPCIVLATNDRGVKIKDGRWVGTVTWKTFERKWELPVESSTTPALDASDLAVRIWRAVLADLPREGVRIHIGCENGPPEECSLFETFSEVVGD